jgi:exonuclease SbcD
MLVIKGDLAKIEKALQQLNVDAKSDTKADTKVDTAAQPVWLCLEVDTQDYLSDLQQRIQTMTQGLNVEVLQLRRTRNQRRQLLSQMQSETLAELTPEDVFEKRLAMETFDTSPEADSEKTDTEQTTLQQMRQRFSQILSEVEHQGTDG